MPPSKPSQKAYSISLLPPPGPNQPLVLPTRTVPSPSTNPQGFNDALAVRLEVFVDEQKCAAEFEIDDDDSRSWHWIIYDPVASVNGGGPTPLNLPVGTVRLVPPPHASHESFVAAYAPGAPDSARDLTADGYDLDHEPYVKFGRVAVLAGYRGWGVARRVMETAMGWAEENSGEINRAFMDVVEREGGLRTDLGTDHVWKGLALVHAQVDVEKFYARLGFVADESLGRWVEEGIEHVGMWKRLDVKGWRFGY
ncbi:acyl-CoA N-acyltransferase [Aspergillus aurantiobrunneus]